MARIRTIKPGFFTSDELAELPPLTRILFAGLWCVADREGRLEDRSKKIKVETLPYDDCDIEEMLQVLETKGFITRYEINGARYIQVDNFSIHQKPNVKEKPSTIPPPFSNVSSNFLEFPRTVMNEHTGTDIEKFQNSVSTILENAGTVLDSHDGNSRSCLEHCKNIPDSHDGNSRFSLIGTGREQEQEQEHYQSANRGGGGDLDEGFASVVRCYESNIAAIVPASSSRLSALYEEFGADWILKAIPIAVQANARKLSYIEGILKRWATDGVDAGAKSKPVEVSEDFSEYERAMKGGLA